MHIVYSFLFLVATFIFMWCSLTIILSAAVLARKEPDPDQTRAITLNILAAAGSFTAMVAYLFIW